MFLLNICCFFLLYSSILIYISLNPVNSTLFLISSFFSLSFIFILTEADFIGLLILIIYVGAIAVLFLFIVMMLNVKLVDKDKHYYFIIGIFFCILFFIQFYYYLIYFFLGSLDTDTNIKTFFFFELDLLDECNKYYLLPLLGYFIFSKYPIFLIVSALMLVNSMIFTIYITHFKYGLTTRTQFNQLSRIPNLYSVHLYC